MKHKLATCWILFDSNQKSLATLICLPGILIMYTILVSSLMKFGWNFAKFNYIRKCISIRPYQFLSNKNWEIKNQNPLNFHKIFWKLHVICVLLIRYVHWTIYFICVSNETQKKRIHKEYCRSYAAPSLSLCLSIGLRPTIHLAHKNFIPHNPAVVLILLFLHRNHLTR